MESKNLPETFEGYKTSDLLAPLRKYSLWDGQEHSAEESGGHEQVAGEVRTDADLPVHSPAKSAKALGTL